MNFSIIVPFYNNISHISRLFLTLKDYIDKHLCEIIIIDDCSKTKDFNALKKYIEKIEEVTSVRVGIVSTSPERDDTIIRG